MKQKFALFLAALFLFPNVWASEKPKRIVSLSLCTDQIVLALVQPSQIAALSHLAVDPTYSYLAEKAKGLPVHYGLAEEIVPLRPDVILGLSYSLGNTQQMLKQLGFEVHGFAPASSIEEVEVFVRDIAKLLGEQERGEQLLEAMHKKIAKAQALNTHKKSVSALVYGPNGFTAGKNTIKSHALIAAGLTNTAIDLGVQRYTNLSVEQVLKANPDVIILDEQMSNQNSLAQNYVNHPVLRHVYAQKRRLQVPTPYWLCAGPSVADAVLTLSRQLHEKQ